MGPPTVPPMQILRAGFFKYPLYLVQLIRTTNMNPESHKFVNPFFVSLLLRIFQDQNTPKMPIHTYNYLYQKYKNNWQPLKFVKLKFMFCKIGDWMS